MEELESKVEALLLQYSAEDLSKFPDGDLNSGKTNLENLPKLLLSLNDRELYAVFLMYRTNLKWEDMFRALSEIVIQSSDNANLLTGWLDNFPEDFTHSSRMRKVEKLLSKFYK